MKALYVYGGIIVAVAIIRLIFWIFDAAEEAAGMGPQR